MVMGLQYAWTWCNVLPSLTITHPFPQYLQAAKLYGMTSLYAVGIDPEYCLKTCQRIYLNRKLEKFSLWWNFMVCSSGFP
jgi:hypothetical protein